MYPLLPARLRGGVAVSGTPFSLARLGLCVDPAVRICRRSLREGSGGQDYRRLGNAPINWVSEYLLANHAAPKYKGKNNAGRRAIRESRTLRGTEYIGTQKLRRVSLCSRVTVLPLICSRPAHEPGGGTNGLPENTRALQSAPEKQLRHSVVVPESDYMLS